jgi:hypothetical protein
LKDHSAFSRARNERFRDSDIFRLVFERVVEACIAAGLVGGEGFAVDASLIVADANKQRSIPGSEWHKERNPETASRATRVAGLRIAYFAAADSMRAVFQCWAAASLPTNWASASAAPDAAALVVSATS